MTYNKNNKWNKCIQLMLEGELTQKQIANQLNVTEQTIINWKKDERFQDLKFKMERDALKEMTTKALNTLNELLNADSETVRYYAVRDILDRAGHKQTDKLEVNSNQNVVVTENPLKGLTTEELKKLADANDN